MFEAIDDKQIKPNEKKGFNWIKEAAENGHLDA
jgi:TPR repeat protein